MTCDGTRGLIDSWQESGMMSEQEFAALEAHLSACGRCRERYALLLPMMRRDGNLGSVMNEEAEAESVEFTRAVMERIHRPATPFARVPTAATRRRVLRISAFAAAAALVFVVGFVLRATWSPIGSDEVVVHFVLDAPGAAQVALVGNFNGWDPKVSPLKRDQGTSRWEISIPLKRGETYLYNFVVNGNTWIPDPATEAQVPDGFGGESSLIQL